MRTGVRHARARVVVILDGDGQNDPATFRRSSTCCDRGATDRLGGRQRVGRKDTASKRVQSRIANRVRAAILKDGTRDSVSGLKAFRRDVFLALPFFDGLHRFMPALVRREGLELRQVEVIDRPRRAWTTHYGMWDRLWVGLLDLFGVWWLIRRRSRVPNVLEVKLNVD